MMAAPLLLTMTLAAALAQDTSRAETIVALAGTGPQASLVEQVRRHPDAAREALHDLLSRSVPGPGARTVSAGPAASTGIVAAERVAQAFFDVWADGFLLQEVHRFAAWSVTDRRVKLAADSLRLAGNEAYAREGVPAAMHAWRTSLAYSRSVGDAAGAARSLGNIGAGFLAEGDADSARAYFAHSYAQAAAVGDLRTAASAVTNVANLDYDAGDLPGAAERYAQAVDLLERTGEYRFLSAAQHNLALVSLAMGNREGARVALTHSIELSRLHGYREDEAEGLSSLADVARAEGRYQEAGDLLDRALALSRESGNQLIAAGARHSMGLLSADRGDYPRALGLLREAQARYVALGHLAEAIDVQEDLARVLVAAGDLQGGIRVLQAATRVADSAGLGPVRSADLELAAADINTALNQYPRALELFRQAGTSYRAAHDEAGQAAALEGEGYLALIRGDATDAVALLERSLAMQARMGNIGLRGSAVTRLYLAAAQEDAGDVGAARQTLTQSRRALASLDDAVGEAAVLATLGALEARAGAASTADSLYRAGLALLGTAPAPEVTWRLHAGRAGVLEGFGDLDGAARELRLAIEAFEGSAETLVLVDQRTAFRANKIGVYRQLSGVELRRGNVVAAFQASERARGQQSFASIGRGRIAAPPLVPRDLLEREQDARQRIAGLTRQLRDPREARLELREPGGAVRSPAAARAELASAQTAYAELRREIRTAAPDYAALVDPVPVLPGAIAARLQPGQALVEYLVDDSVTRVFVVTRDTVAAMTLDIGGGRLGELVDFARGTIARGGRADSGQLWRTPLQRLEAQLIRPLEEAGLLPESGSLVIVADQELHYLPFEALLQPDGGSFLTERYVVSYAPSATTWVELVDRAASPRGSYRMLALAPKVDQLPGSRYEVEVLGRLFGNDTQVLIGRQATEAAFRAAAPAFDLVHLATFGVLNKSNPLFSRIELAETRDDLGMLETHEVFGLGLRAHLLTLSACETAVTAGTRWDAPPGEDWVSLAVAFLGAGADNVLASLWRVEDLATAELMQRFYRHLASGAPLASSLALAQRELITNPDTAHPLYWAGFVLLGGEGPR